MTITTKLQVAQKQAQCPQWTAPQWVVEPAFTDIAIGDTVAVTAGTYTGYPAPTITNIVTVDGVPKAWPYVVQAADAGKTLSFQRVLTNPMGMAASHAISAVPTILIPPGALHGLDVTQVTSSSLTLAWGVPITGGTPDHYVVQWRVSGSGSWSAPQTTTALTYTVSGLSASTAYDVMVFATNNAGDGPATTRSSSTIAVGAGYWPTSKIGVNVAVDQNYSTKPVFSDRSLAFGANSLRAIGGGMLQPTDFDATTHYPNKSYQFTAVANPEATNTRNQGTWTFVYNATQQLTVTANSAPTGSSQLSSTWDSGTGNGVIQWNIGYANGTATWICQVTVPSGAQITSAQLYPPYVNYSTDPFWQPQFLRTLQPYAYLRFMDWSGVNGDYYTTAAKTAFPLAVNWADRITPATVHTNSMVANGYYQRGYPLEWQVGLCNTLSKDGWFNLSLNSTDDCVTQFATYLASNLSAGLKCTVELGNEAWNPFLGCYAKCQIAAMAQVAAVPRADNTYASYWSVNAGTLSCDGTRITITTTNPHGITGNTDGVTGNYIYIGGIASSYAAYAPKQNTIFRVDSTTSVSYPVSQAATPGSCAVISNVAATSWLASNTSIVSLNAGNTTNGTMAAAANTNTNLICGILATGGTPTLYMYTQWFRQREYDVMLLVRAAFAAAGRANDVATVYSIQAGQGLTFFQSADKILGVSGRTQPLNQVYTAINVGSYLTLSEGGTVYQTQTVGFFNPVLNGTTSIGTSSTAAATIVANAQAQLRAVCDVGYGMYGYGMIASYAASKGLGLRCYEVGVDTSSFSATADMTTVNLVDSGTPSSSIRTIVKEWLWNLQALGFTHMGWYTEGGTSQQNGTGCFNLSATADAQDPTLSSSGWAPKFAGLLDAMSAPALISSRPQNFKRVSNHVCPCTLSGYDYVGNEAVYVNPTSWPDLYTTYDPAQVYSFYGPNRNGKTYYFWSETAVTATLSMTGHCTSTGNQTLTVQVLGQASPAGTLTAPARGGSASSAVSFGSVSVSLQPGPNWVFISAPTPTSVFPHSVSIA